MPEPIATLLVHLLGLYAALGALFAVPFAVWGAGRIDADAASGTWGFRLMILPGAVELWPLLAIRWSRARGAR